MALYLRIISILVALVNFGLCLHHSKTPASFIQVTEGKLTPLLIGVDYFVLTWAKSSASESYSVNITGTEEPCLTTSHTCNDSQCTFDSREVGDDCPFLYWQLEACRNLTVDVSTSESKEEPWTIAFNLAPRLKNGAIVPKLTLAGNKATVDWKTTADVGGDAISCLSFARIELKVGDGTDLMVGANIEVSLDTNSTDNLILSNCQHGDLSAKVVYMTKTGEYPTDRVFVDNDNQAFAGDAGVTELTTAVSTTQSCSLDITWNDKCQEEGKTYTISWGTGDTETTDMSFTIPDLEKAISYTVSVQASWSNGTETGEPTTVNSTILDPVVPNAPDTPGLVSSEGPPWTLTVNWNKPTGLTCSDTITDYIITYNGSSEPVSTGSVELLSYNLTDLYPCTTYEVTVAAKSGAGEGKASDAASQITGSQDPEQPIITEKSKGKKKIKFSWTESDPIKANSCPISEYTVDWMPKEGNGSGAYESYTITGLTCNKNYNVTITATATDDKSTSSQGKIIKTDDTAPGNTTVDSVSPVDANSTQLTVKWSIPSYDCFPGSNLGDYKVSWRAEGEGQSTHSQNEASTSYTINDLVYCTTYTVNVRARSSSGLLGDQAGSKKATTNADQPGKPTITKEIPNTESITLTWKPNIANSCAFAGYTVNWSPDGGDGSDEIGNTSYNITGLTCNKNYTVSVTTRAVDDQINTSDEKVITTSDEAPGQVKGAKFVADSSTQFTASWTPPDYDCTESTLGAYKVTWTPGGDAVTIEIDEPHLTISNLIPCTEYTVNIAGSSETDITGQIVTSTITLLNDFPGKSTNVAEGDITPHSLEVEWNAPLKVPPYGNNCPITNYTVQCAFNNSTMVEKHDITDPEMRTYTFDGLKACTKYNIIVIAYTETGGTASDLAIYETGTNAPPVDTVSITPESRSAHVTWKRPPNTACELEYEVTYTGTTLWTNNKTDNSGELEPINNQDDTVAADLDKLLAYTSYEICVTIKTGNTTCNTTEMEMEVPTAPRDIEVEEGSKTKVSLTLTWQYPEAENGILLEYWVSWELEGESSNNYTDSVTAEITSYTISDLDEGTYIFKVIAVNSKGHSLWSEKIEQWMDGPSPVCGGGCIAGIVIGILLVALLIPAFIFRDRIKEKIKPGSPLKKSGYELKGATFMKTEFRRHVTDIASDGAEAAYQKLINESPHRDTFAASKPFNKDKNRFDHIYPFNESRVKLQLLSNGPKGSDYINANHITFPDMSTLQFIATQGPLDKTISDFWRMVWEQNVYDVVMLCNLVEEGNSKCAKYWCDEGEVATEFGDFKIDCQAVEEDKRNQTITRYINIVKNGQRRFVKQHHYVAWPANGVPDNEDDMLKFLASIKGKLNSNGKNIVVHGSAGIGRTGTFIGLWVLTNTLDEIKYSKSIDVHTTALRMRECRPDMVQTKDQYLYLHKCLLKYMEDKGNPFPISNKDEDEPVYGNVNTGYQQ